MLLLCIPMLLVYMYLYVTRMYSYVLVCTLIYLYVGSMYSYVTHMLLVVSVCGFSHDQGLRVLTGGIKVTWL